MCGIAGILSCAGRHDDVRLVHEMTARLSHRGPDHRSVHVSRAGDAVLGMTTLSIVAYHGGFGPRIDATTGVAVTYNGQIYGFRRLARTWGIGLPPDGTDLDFVLLAYLARGIDFLEEIDGMYAIAIHDPRERATYLVRDRVGQKPLYIYQAVGRLHFASEVKAFPAEARLNAHLPGSVAAVETFIGARTPYPDVERVGPGTCIRVDHRTGRRTAWIYWSIEAIAQEGGEAPNTADVWVDQYAGAVARSAEEQRPLGLDHALLLSGGLDSAVLAYTMRPPVCVTVRYPGEPVPDESPRARRIAQDIGAEIVVVEPSVADFRDTAEEIVDALDYPVGNASFLSEFTAYRAVSARGLRVVTAGIGPDEYLLGYVRHLMALNDPDAVLAAGNAAYQPLADRIRRLGPVSAADRYLALILRGSDDPSVLSLVRGVFSSGLRTDQALTVVDHHLSLPALLATSDKLASKFSLERRSPYLAQKVVEISVQAPKPIRVAPLNRSKALLREAAVRLGVPEWATRPDGKVGFASPVPSWLQGPLSVWCEERIRAALDGPIAPSVAEFVARGLNQSGTAHDRSRMMALMWALWAAKESECKGARVGGG